MPLYEYECESCGKRFERIQKFSDPPVEKCVYCSGPLHKVLSPPALVFKGTGWYVTDYARKNSSWPDNGGKTKEKDSEDNGKKETAPAAESVKSRKKESDN